MSQKVTVFVSIPIQETPAVVVKTVSQKTPKLKNVIHRVSARPMEVMWTAMVMDLVDNREEMQFARALLVSRMMD